MSHNGVCRNAPVISSALNSELANEVNRRKTKMEKHAIVTAIGVTMVTDITIPKDIFFIGYSEIKYKELLDM